jgi:Restriction endonuclease
MPVSSEIEDLHHAAFGLRPAKAGTAYERLSAVVLATRGWQNVVHDTSETAPGKRAAHQLDVTGCDPSGLAKRLIVECKDWDQVVDQATIDKLVGVRAQLGADAAAVITTKGYTAGAIAVAVDENIGLWRLRPFDPDNPEPYVKQITLTVIAVVSTYSDVTVEVPENRFPPGTPTQARAWTGDRLLYGDGSPAETLQEVLEGQRAKLDDEGGPSYSRQISFSDGRLLPVEGGDPVPIAGLSWTETVHRSPHTTVTEAQGEPVLILEQLDDNGELESGQMVVDRELFAWDIDADGNVRPRGSLARSAELESAACDPTPLQLALGNVAA